VARVLEAARAPDLDRADCLRTAQVPDDWVRGRSTIGVVCEMGRETVTRELLGGAADLARQIGARVAALDAADSDGAVLSAQGADIVVRLAGRALAEDVAAAVGQWGASQLPWAIILPGTLWGREVAGRAAVCLEAGLTGDVIELEVSDGRLAAWKPAFGGQLVAAINTSSPIQMATVRPGAFATLAPRAPRNIEVQLMPVPARSRVVISEQYREDDIQRLLSATAVVGVGAAIEPQRYAELDPLLGALGAQLAATRRVTDKGWLPHARQVGLTGHSIAPRVYLAIGISGSSNHMIGVRRAGTIIAINSDPEAPITRIADITVVADWGDFVPLLVNLLPKRV
jgi:electron transfer flavoprotein alpha subunit